MTHPLIVQTDGSIIDHIGIGVADFDAALADIEKRLGVRPRDLGAFGAQRRAVGRLGDHGFLEALGPAARDAALLDPMVRLASALGVQMPVNEGPEPRVRLAVGGEAGRLDIDAACR